MRNGPWNQYRDENMQRFVGTEMYVDEQTAVVTSRLARRGLVAFRVTFNQTDPEVVEAEVSARVRRGPFGWYARRWVRRHPIQFTCQIYTQLGGWREYRTSVKVI